jgi:hypothetical protein
MKIFIIPEYIASENAPGHLFTNGFLSLLKNPDCLLVHAKKAYKKDVTKKEFYKPNGDLDYDASGYIYVDAVWIEENRSNDPALDPTMMHDPTNLFECTTQQWYHLNYFKDITKYNITDANHEATAQNHAGPWKNVDQPRIYLS